MVEFFLQMGLQDWLGLAFFLVAWVGYARYSEHDSRIGESLLSATNRYRLQWMREMMARENRSLDAITIGNVTRSITFFGSTTLFIVAGLLSSLGYRERINALVEEIPYAMPSTPFSYQLKILLLVIIFIYAFFKYTWSMRQYNYVSIYIAAAPDYRVRTDEHEQIAVRGAFLTGNAAKHFNYGLRAYYFGMAALAWFIHPYAFIGATAWVIYVTYRREFRSATLRNLAQ